ncbi:TonB-dependent receptor [Aureispira anguillae]|uniref:TonB-dependent receptor n=1 Tax=Aureispira anguillae TaxID=2864201 RepID=A0A915YDS3_9BACT|nr:TonB-dependent receptor [Aureispira anguillae]BDS11209.1 TonB-dependent receptor [Aureispira anguillae]
MRSYFFVLIFFFFFFHSSLFAKEEVHAQIVEHQTGLAIPFVNVFNKQTKVVAASNDVGWFRIEGSPTDTIEFSCLGYKTQTVIFRDIIAAPQIKLEVGSEYLQEISIVADRNTTLGTQQIDKIDLKLMPANNAQDLLRTMSGVFIAQHAGGGKAEQIFLRGFDNDHGTDFAVFVDGIPINLSNHAHGQGYADMHFMIPELIQDADFYKGSHEIQNGNFAVSGAARFKMINGLSKNSIKLDIGQYGFLRGLVRLNLTPKNRFFSKKNYEKAFLAIEGTLNRGFFEADQKFKKLNAVFKYNTQIGSSTSLTVGASYFKSSWDASGQIPLRAVTNNTIGWFGAIDDTEGGSTGRINASIKLASLLGKNQRINNFAYYSNNQYQLFSNFTFFLNDSLNGDMIDQVEQRNLFGYTFEYHRNDKLFARTTLKSTISAGIRADFTHSKMLSSIQRKALAINDNNNVQEINYWLYIKERWRLNEQWIVQFGTRLDLFQFKVNNQLEQSSKGRIAHRFSPKISIFYNPIPELQLFLKGGSGFHSNYAQAAVENLSVDPLPRALSADFGGVARIAKKWIVSATTWLIQSDAEYLFVPDAGEFEDNGKSLRYGLDFSTKYEPIRNLWLNLALNYSYGILLEEPEDANSIPSAPRFTSTASISYNHPIGIDAYIGMRYMGIRPLIEDESVMADPYFLLDASLSYTYKSLTFGVSAQNLLNSQWMEAVFYDASRLRQETMPVDDFHFTPGTPIFIKGSATYTF